MSRLVQPGEFCPNREYDDYGKLQSERQQNIIKFGKTMAGRQRHERETFDGTLTRAVRLQRPRP